MLDLKIIRQNPTLVKDVIKKRNLTINLDDFLVLDTQRNTLIQQIDDIRQIKNKLSKEIPTLSPDVRKEKIEESKLLGEKLLTLEEEQKINLEKWTYLYHRMPNLLDDTAAVGNTDADNKVEKLFLEPKNFGFPVVSHWEIGEKKEWINLEKGTEVSGARFWYLKGDLALLNMAIVNYAISVLCSKGFEFFIPPYMVKEASLFGTGFLPAGEDGNYIINPGEDDLYLIATAEIPLTSYHMNEVIDVEKPRLYFGYSPCFRKEAGSYGKDTKGILRGHQFEKIEMVVFCKPSESKKMHDTMVAIEEEIWQSFKIPYQKLNVCSGDLGNPAMKKYDLEAWIPSQEKYREVTSCSNVGEFQSRRLNVKYKNTQGELEFVHTLNGTVIALSRCLIAIMENYQTAEGDVKIPDVLKPFMGGRERI